MDAVAPGLQAVFDYHQASKHRFEAYAPGPGRLDWANQPDPFRRYAGARLLKLPLVPASDAPRFDAVFETRRLSAGAPLDRHGVSQLFYDSLALSAWKQLGATRWALRVNASSGNLHPTEGYLICGPVDGLCETPLVCHYAPREHALEVRARFDLALWHALRGAFPPHTLFVGLSSVHWREAWKYGRRAYRYCMHDVGHALGALSIAAAGLGWQTRLLDGLGSEDLALLLGTFSAHDAQSEEADLLVACVAGEPPEGTDALPEAAIRAFRTLAWRGRANRLSPSTVDWGMPAIAAAVRKPRGARYAVFAHPPLPSALAERPLSLRRIIRQRRSAVAMDGHTRLPREAFYRMLLRTLATPGAAPFAVLPWKPHLHMAIFVHRVEGLPPGLYLLLRDPGQRGAWEKALGVPAAWQRPSGCPQQLPLYRLIDGDTRAAARHIACHQDIASDGCFSLAMLAEFSGPLERYGAWFYPRLYWEAGMIGQVLYLEAEAAGVRGTGIGCYFDDPLHDLLGLRCTTFQDLYHFAVGGGVDDARLTSLPAYPVGP